MSAFFLGHPKETDLALFAGGESGPFARWRIERHVERCAQCEEIAADFFRLPDQLNELAELPSVDWKQMAMAIESGIRADRAAVEPARRAGFSPLLWQAGLVAATVVVAVIVVRSPDEPQAERESIAVGPIAAPMQIAEQKSLATQAVERDAAPAEPARSAPVVAEAEAPLAKAREERQTFASDIAAPAAPPPPAAVLNESVSRRVAVVAAPLPVAAESAEGRLRSDAAARVGAVVGLAASDQAGGARPTAAAPVEQSVETVNFADAPLRALSGYSLLSGGGLQTPRIVLTNETEKMISGFTLVWIVGDGASQSRARIVRGDLAMAPRAVNVTGGGDEWRSPAGASNRMRVYLSSVAFADGTTWSPATADISSKGLTAPVGVQELQPVGHNF